MGRPKGSLNVKTILKNARIAKSATKVHAAAPSVSSAAEIEQNSTSAINKYIQDCQADPTLIHPDLRNTIVDQYLTRLNSDSEPVPDFLRDIIINKYKFKNSVGTKEEIIAALPKNEILFIIPDDIAQALIDKLPAIKEKYPFNNYQEFIANLTSVSLNLFLQTV